MYNLKKRRPLNYQELLEFYKEEAIYMYYLGDSFCVNRFIESPFPDREDSTPSFILRYKNNILIWHDFGDPKAYKYPKSIVGFVMRYFECSSYIEAINKIMEDMESFNANENLLRELELIRKKSGKKVNKGITVRKEFTEFELKFWASLGVDSRILKKFNVRGVVEVFIDDKLWRKASKYDPIFAYILNSEVDNYAFQIYRPLSEMRSGKFRDHNTEGHLFGIAQLPAKGKVLIITKSCKDVLVLASRGYNAIAPFSEASYIHLISVLPSLINRFEKVFIMYDPDPTGIGYSQKIVDDFSGTITNIIIPENFEKDPADNVINGLEEEFFSFLKNKISQ